MARCGSSFSDSYYCGDSSWNQWGRWVLFGATVIGVIVLFFLFSCITARRRRKRGIKPFYGTGWASNGQGGYNPQYQNQQQPPPQYGNQAGQGYQQPGGYGQQGGYYGQNTGQYGANQGYYGGQPATELQQPPNTYQGGDQVYAPPPGPPPAK